MVEGYDPKNAFGLPKAIESSLDPLFNPPNGELDVDLVILDCRTTILMDKAFERKRKDREEQWDKRHIGLALKFDGPDSAWHCIWAALEEYDKDAGACVFRSYDDVFLQQVERSPKKRRIAKLPTYNTNCLPSTIRFDTTRCVYNPV